MANITELAAEILSAHASSTPLTGLELLDTLKKIHATLSALEAGEAAPLIEEAKPQMKLKEAFKKNEVVCMICGKGGMKTLSRHLSTAHGLKPSEYRKQFGIPRTQSLTAKNFSDSRREMATNRNLADNLAKARAVRAANAAEKATKAKPAKKPKKK